MSEPEKFENEFAMLKRFKQNQKENPNGIRLVISEYPYRFEIGCETGAMAIDSISSDDEDKRWVKKGAGRVELLSKDEMRALLHKKSEELFHKHSYLIMCFQSYVNGAGSK